MVIPTVVGTPLDEVVFQETVTPTIYGAPLDSIVVPDFPEDLAGNGVTFEGEFVTHEGVRVTWQ
jgi:hypothetical protein